MLSYYYFPVCLVLKNAQDKAKTFILMFFYYMTHKYQNLKLQKCQNLNMNVLAMSWLRFKAPGVRSLVSRCGVTSFTLSYYYFPPYGLNYLLFMQALHNFTRFIICSVCLKYVVVAKCEI